MFWKNEKNNDIKNYFVERYRVAHPAERDAPQVPDVLSNHAHVDDVIVKSDHAHVDDVIVKSDRAHVDDVTTRRSLIRRLIFPSQQADADSLKLVQWITVILSKFLFWTCPMSVYTRLHVNFIQGTC